MRVKQIFCRVAYATLLFFLYFSSFAQNAVSFGMLGRTNSVSDVDGVFYSGYSYVRNPISYSTQFNFRHELNTKIALDIGWLRDKEVNRRTLNVDRQNDPINCPQLCNFTNERFTTITNRLLTNFNYSLLKKNKINISIFTGVNYSLDKPGAYQWNFTYSYVDPFTLGDSTITLNRLEIPNPRTLARLGFQTGLDVKVSLYKKFGIQSKILYLNHRSQVTVTDILYINGREYKTSFNTPADYWALQIGLTYDLDRRTANTK